jgi:hypothetical protein
MSETGVQNYDLFDLDIWLRPASLAMARASCCNRRPKRVPTSCSVIAERGKRIERPPITRARSPLPWRIATAIP